MIESTDIEMIAAISADATELNWEKITPDKCIFVCTFCQVFSSSDSLIADHINSQHKDSLLSGTTAENFVSKLQALPNDNKKKCPKKPGRPRRIPVEKSSPEKKKPDPEPLPGPNGLYWCKKCMKYFKKSRQLTRHVCFDIDEDEFLNESAEESDSSNEFKTYMNVEPIPWQRRPKRFRKMKLQVNTDQEISKDEEAYEPECKVVLNWREDPSYVPLFGNESERLAFEKHLKSIDYSCVDNLFVKEEKKVRGKRKRNSFQSIGFIYSCIICQQVKNSLTHIRMHCLTHTEVKPFTCPKCPYRSNTKGSLYSHMRNHTGNVFRCSKCNFQSTKRAHLLDHEETHSVIPLWCKLCKNLYKNVRSLIAHVKKYHNNPGGKKYVKFLTSKNHKEIHIQCQNCPQKFTSQSSFDIHNQNVHFPTVQTSEEEKNVETTIQELTSESAQINESSLTAIPASSLDYQNEILAIKDPLAEIVLNNILQQKTSENIELYEDMFQQSTNTALISSSDSRNENFSPDSTSPRLASVNNTSQFNPSETVLEECSKTLSFEILDECLRDPKFAEGISEACIPSKLQNNTFDMSEMPLSFQDESLMASGIRKTNQNIPEELTELNANLAYKNSLNESKPAEMKLFEKCRRAPAYVCCVCSGIFICPSTLKAHLKEHINTTSSLIEEAAQDLEKMVERDADLEAILQGPTDSCTNDERELEKLYTSSLDMIWYLPEVSVVLENDPALFDSMLEDISNFPISDKFDETGDIGEIL